MAGRAFKASLMEGCTFRIAGMQSGRIRFASNRGPLARTRTDAFIADGIRSSEVNVLAPVEINGCEKGKKQRRCQRRWLSPEAERKAALLACSSRHIA